MDTHFSSPFNSDEANRQGHIIKIFSEAFGDLIRRNPDAWRDKFRKMSATPFAFYRGSAALFFDDMANFDDDELFLDEKTSRVWIHGDLHCENFGTYMNGNGVLVFDVNDFDEAWVAPFTWDLKRLAASLALVGFAKAMSDDEIHKVVGTCMRSYAGQVGQFATNQLSNDFALTQRTTSGKIRELLLESRLRSRVALLDKVTEIHDYDRRFKINKYNIALDASTRADVDSAFRDYLTTIPQDKQKGLMQYHVKDICEVRGAGIGSVGFTMYSILVEGPTESLENDRIISMKVGQVPSASRVTKHDEKIRGLFHHHGHRTVLSQRALQAYSDPWIGHTILGGVGQFVAEYSPYTADLEWDDLNRLEDIVQVGGFLGQAVAKIHCVSDVDSDANVVPFSTDDAIHAVLKCKENEFVSKMTDFALAYGNVVRDDYRLFVDAFRNHLFPGL